ncbi:RYamide receptor-like [Mizuhopecten yessoensis]|uniref:Neuropeptide Y receptor n=1 Tax=Mizuhopecten yessoensis TaxID=6573 RepID=A0A210PZL6_MIZYE|nr:RYamide receptor-like [Mizuhopecten yessoensis]OWF41941.1 Neuropeptide Y receptor [Mizuhopecten yessoensis]
MATKSEPFYGLNKSLNNDSSDGDPVNDNYGIPEEFQFILLGMYGVTCLVVLFGNGIICYTNFKIQSFRTVTNFFIVSLAITDIIMTILCVPFSILSNLFFHYWPFWGFLCPIVLFVQTSSVLLRSFMLIAMTCDMYHVATKPLKPRLLTKCRARILVACICAMSGAISIPTFLYADIEYMAYEPGSKGLCMEKWPDDFVRSVYGVCIMMLQYFIPLIIIAVTYIHIGVIIWVKRTPGEAITTRDERLASSKKKTIKMIIVVVIAYLLSWLPLHVITIVGDLDQSIFDADYVHMMWLAAHWLAFSNSGVNPVIFFWMNTKFRHNFIVCIHTKCCCQGKHLKTLTYKDSFAMTSDRKSNGTRKVSTGNDTSFTMTSYQYSTASPREVRGQRFFGENGVKEQSMTHDKV